MTHILNVQYSDVIDTRPAGSWYEMKPTVDSNETKRLANISHYHICSLVARPPLSRHSIENKELRATKVFGAVGVAPSFETTPYITLYH